MRINKMTVNSIFQIPRLAFVTSKYIPSTLKIMIINQNLRKNKQQFRIYTKEKD